MRFSMILEMVDRLSGPARRARAGTKSLADNLERVGVKRVSVHRGIPNVEFVMKPFAMNPLLSPDWMARLSHRYLKGSIQQAVHFGETSDIHGTHPVPAYAFGAELRNGPGGTF